MNQIQTNQHYRIGKNIIRVTNIKDDNVEVILNGFSTYSGWSKKEMDTLLQENLIEQIL